jgi:hypothetical protein
MMINRADRDADDPRVSRILLRKELLAQGLNDRAIVGLVREGVLHRVRYGAYVAGDAWRALDDPGRHGLLARAVIRAARTEVVLSHVSALPEWDVPIWDLDLSTVHVTRSDQRGGRAEAGVRQHVGELRPTDVVERNGVLVTSPTRTGLDVTTLADIEHSIVVLDHLLHQGLTNKILLSEGLQFMRCWPETLRTDVCIRLADGRAESVAESRSRYLCWWAGLPAPEPQFEITDERGRVVARVDLAWPEHGVFLEFDGKVKYTKHLREGEDVTGAVLREKQREQMICELTGWRCIRIVWSDLARPEITAQRILRLLSARGH